MILYLTLTSYIFVDLFHSFLTQAKTPEDAEEGILFMQEMIQIAKERDLTKGTIHHFDANL